MTDKEFADELDARKRIESHGYKRKPCKACNGHGYVSRPSLHDYPVCLSCGGKGYLWESLTR